LRHPDRHVPLLVQAGDAAPLLMLVPFIYVQLKLSYRAYSIATAHLLAIQAFYGYGKSRDLGLPLRIDSGFTGRLRHLFPKRPSNRQPGRPNRYRCDGT